MHTVIHEPMRDSDRRKSKYLSWLLRHGAHQEGLTMDAAGWSPVSEVLARVGLSMGALEHIVATNTKQRLQLEGDRVRACQGHSVDNHAVSREGLEGSWQTYSSSPSVWHGTSVEAVEGIAAEGISSVKRTHVHCAPNPDSLVGKRHNVSVLLEVSVERLRAEGIEVFESPNGVVLMRWVPPQTIVSLRPVSRRGKNEAARLRALLGL